MHFVYFYNLTDTPHHMPQHTLCVLCCILVPSFSSSFFSSLFHLFQNKNCTRYKKRHMLDKWRTWKMLGNKAHTITVLKCQSLIIPENNRVPEGSRWLHHTCMSWHYVHAFAALCDFIYFMRGKVHKEYAIKSIPHCWRG